MRAHRGRRRGRAAARELRALRTRAQVPVARVVRRPRQEREPRRRDAQGRARRRAATLPSSPRWSTRFARERGVARRPRCSRATRRTSSARARAFVRSRRSGATCRGARTIRGCTSMPFRRGRITASASCACSRNVQPDASRACGASASRSRRWRRRCCRASVAPLPGLVGGAGGAARHQGPAQPHTTT